MQEIASGGQLRMALLRWLLLTVPAMLGLGALSARLALSNHACRWFGALHAPQPDLHFLSWGWLFCYAALAVALAILIAARGARGRSGVIALILIITALLFAWHPMVFGMQLLTFGCWSVACTALLTLCSAIWSWHIRPVAAVLLVAVAAWLAFVALAFFRLDAQNPHAENLVVPVASTNIGAIIR